MSETPPAPFVSALSELVWLGGKLPVSLRERLAGDPVIVDGQVLEPEVQVSLPLFERIGTDGPEAATLEESRQSTELRARIVRGRRIPIEKVEDLTVAGAAGDLPARLYTPRAAGRGLLVYFHGGGWVVGSLESHDQPCRFLAARSGQRVLAVDYRLAPEHPFPAAADDAVAAFGWAVANATALGVDPSAVAVGGDSAGANLAAIVATPELSGGGPVPAMQALIYPVTDLLGDYASHALFGEGYFLTNRDREWYEAHYLADPDDERDPRASPVLADSLAGAAPAYVAIAGFDPLRDEGLAYARRLSAEGVDTELRLHRGLIHGFANAVGVSRASAAAMSDVAAAVRAGLADFAHGHA